MNALDVLKYGEMTALGALDGFPDSEWETPGACGVWSVKQIMAHLASYEALMGDIFASLAGDEPTPALDRMLDPAGDFNDGEVSDRVNLTPEETVAEFGRWHDRAITTAGRLSTENLRQVGTLPWYGLDYSLEDVIVYMNYGHKREHAAQIMAFRDVLNR